MSTYLRMWALVKEATPEERQKFLDEHVPATGRDVEFRGDKFLDVDLFEALRNAH